jgi:hypothetical protein
MLFHSAMGLPNLLSCLLIQGRMLDHMGEGYKRAAQFRSKLPHPSDAKKVQSQAQFALRTISLNRNRGAPSRCHHPKVKTFGLFPDSSIFKGLDDPKDRPEMCGP